VTDGTTGTPGPKAKPATVERRFAVAAAFLGFGIGLALGLKLAGGMEPVVKVIETPVKVPCRDCAEREKARLEAETQAVATAASLNGEAPADDPAAADAPS